MLLGFKLGYTEMLLCCFRFVIKAGLLTHLSLEKHPVSHSEVADEE